MVKISMVRISTVIVGETGGIIRKEDIVTEIAQTGDSRNGRNLKKIHPPNRRITMSSVENC
jgi:hypothetical protein